jgi:NADPH:quinone reductase-like Zn-dependent oxidoreductase
MASQGASTAEAWFLHDAASGQRGFVRASFDPGPPRAGEVIAEPLYGSWEGNMSHAYEGRPIDLCQYRGEPRVIVGNAGVVRIVACGPGADRLRPGDVALIYSGCDLDRHGYPAKIWGYDAPGTMGCLATRIRMSEDNLLALPRATRHPLRRWAAFSVRYITAWSNWSLAHRTYRLMVGPDQDPAPNVWGWGGGTTLAQLDLARRAGARTVMFSSSEARMAVIRGAGIEPVDRRRFGSLDFDEAAFAGNAEARRAYLRAEGGFLACVRELTGGRGVQIFVDNIGGPLQRATQRALSREGIVTTCGWKEGMRIQYLRAVACIGRQQQLNTHYATYAEAEQAVAFAEEHGWLPPVDDHTYSFDDVPALAAEFAANRTGLFPIYRVHGE